MTQALLKLNMELTKQQDLSGSTPTHFAASADDPSLDTSSWRGPWNSTPWASTLRRRIG